MVVHLTSYYAIIQIFALKKKMFSKLLNSIASRYLIFGSAVWCCQQCSGGSSVHQDYIVWHWTFLLSYDDDKWPTSPFRFAITPSWRVYGNKLCLAGFTSHQGFSFCYICYSWLNTKSWFIFTVLKSVFYQIKVFLGYFTGFILPVSESY